MLSILGFAWGKFFCHDAIGIMQLLKKLSNWCFEPSAAVDTKQLGQSTSQVNTANASINLKT